MELDNTRKLQLAFILVMFGAAAYFVYSKWDDIIGNPKDQTITVFQEFKRTPFDPKKPISSSNPVDPKKSPIVTTFACSDGKLEISQFAPATELQPRLRFIPDVRRGEFVMYRHHDVPLDEIPDACKRALVHSARQVALGRNPAIVGELDRDQRAKEKDARQKLTQTLSDLQNNSGDGSIAPEVYKNFLESLEKYNANTAELAKDEGKRNQAREVIRTGLEYVAKTEEVRQAASAQYVSTIQNMLSSEQRDRLAEIGNRIIQRQQASAKK